MKHNSSKRKYKCVMVVSLTSWMKPSQIASNKSTGSQNSKKSRERPDLLCRFFGIALSHSRPVIRVFTGVKKELAQESDWEMVGPPALSSLSRSKFCPQSLRKNFFWNSPQSCVPESTSPLINCSSARQTRLTIIFITSWPARRCLGIRAPRWLGTLLELSRCMFTQSRDELFTNEKDCFPF